MCRLASSQAAEATETTPTPIAVSARARLPVLSADSNRRSSSGPVAPPLRAWACASFTWLRICGSPTIIDSIPEATRNRCVTANASVRS